MFAGQSEDDGLKGIKLFYSHDYTALLMYKTTDINNLQISPTKQKILHLAKYKNAFKNVKTLSWAIPHKDLRMKRYWG